MSACLLNATEYRGLFFLIEKEKTIFPLGEARLTFFCAAMLPQKNKQQAKATTFIFIQIFLQGKVLLFFARWYILLHSCAGYLL